jgi:hypothetical protein
MNTIPQRASLPPAYEIEEDEAYYVSRPHSSARRYQNMNGDQVIQRGNKQIVIHQGTPPGTRRLHWSVILGLGMILALVLWIGASEALAWWTNHQLDVTFGMPRISQADALVYPADTQAHPSHYIFLNLNGTIMIVELPRGDSAHARIYKGPSVYSDNPSYTPVTGEFQHVDGKIKMIVRVGDQSFVYVNDGTQFKPQQ